MSVYGWLLQSYRALSPFPSSLCHLSLSFSHYNVSYKSTRLCTIIAKYFLKHNYRNAYPLFTGAQQFTLHTLIIMFSHSEIVPLRFGSFLLTQQAISIISQPCKGKWIYNCHSKQPSYRALQYFKRNTQSQNTTISKNNFSRSSSRSDLKHNTTHRGRKKEVRQLLGRSVRLPLGVATK